MKPIPIFLLSCLLAASTHVAFGGKLNEDRIDRDWLTTNQTVIECYTDGGFYGQGWIDTIQQHRRLAENGFIDYEYRLHMHIDMERLERPFIFVAEPIVNKFQHHPQTGMLVPRNDEDELFEYINDIVDSAIIDQSRMRVGNPIEWRDGNVGEVVPVNPAIATVIPSQTTYQAELIRENDITYFAGFFQTEVFEEIVPGTGILTGKMMGTMLVDDETNLLAYSTAVFIGMMLDEDGYETPLFLMRTITGQEDEAGNLLPGMLHPTMLRHFEAIEEFSLLWTGMPEESEFVNAPEWLSVAMLWIQVRLAGITAALDRRAYTQDALGTTWFPLGITPPENDEDATDEEGGIQPFFVLPSEDTETQTFSTRRVRYLTVSSQSSGNQSNPLEGTRIVPRNAQPSGPLSNTWNGAPTSITGNIDAGGMFNHLAVNYVKADAFARDVSSNVSQNAWQRTQTGFRYVNAARQGGREGLLNEVKNNFGNTLDKVADSANRTGFHEVAQNLHQLRSGISGLGGYPTGAPDPHRPPMGYEHELQRGQIRGDITGGQPATTAGQSSTSQAQPQPQAAPQPAPAPTVQQPATPTNVASQPQPAPTPTEVARQSQTAPSPTAVARQPQTASTPTEVVRQPQTTPTPAEVARQPQPAPTGTASVPQSSTPTGVASQPQPSIPTGQQQPAYEFERLTAENNPIMRQQEEWARQAQAQQDFMRRLDEAQQAARERAAQAAQERAAQQQAQQAARQQQGQSGTAAGQQQQASTQRPTQGQAAQEYWGAEFQRQREGVAAIEQQRQEWRDAQQQRRDERAPTGGGGSSSGGGGGAVAGAAVVLVAVAQLLVVLVEAQPEVVQLAVAVLVVAVAVLLVAAQEQAEELLVVQRLVEPQVAHPKQPLR